jgi:hypothetical protein
MLAPKAIVMNKGAGLSAKGSNIVKDICNTHLVRRSQKRFHS